jgi:hypothetical protein
MVEDCFGLFLILRDETLFSPRTVIPFQSAGEARRRSLLAAGAVLGSVFWPASTLAQAASSIWEHNGSAVSLSSNGSARQFYYQYPHGGLQDVGVTTGTLLFDGHKTGNQYVGKAYVFSRACGAIAYDVAGPISADQRTVTLRGNAPQVDSRCQVVGYRDDILIFNFSSTSVDPKPDRNVAASDTYTRICTQPVFGDELTLKSFINGSEKVTDFLADAIHYLRTKYCREVDVALTSDQSTHLGDNCYEYSGIFRGERVFGGAASIRS